MTWQCGELVANHFPNRLITASRGKIGVFRAFSRLKKCGG